MIHWVVQLFRDTLSSSGGRDMSLYQWEHGQQYNNIIPLPNSHTGYLNIQMVGFLSSVYSYSAAPTVTLSS